jgi:rRNA-processing protein FCF1
VKPDSAHNILLDTSFILSMLRDHREFDQEIRNTMAGPLRITTTDGVMMELQRLARSGNFATAALSRVALTTLEKKRIEVQDTWPSMPSVDISILAQALADKGQVEVATVDRRLRALLLKLGVGVIYPRRGRGVVVSPFARVSLK